MTVKADLAALLSTAIAAAGGELDAPKIEGLFSEPPNRELGDIAFPCFQLARQLRKGPPLIAKDLAERLAEPIAAHPALASVVATGPYLNIKLDAANNARTVLTRAMSDDVGRLSDGAGRVIAIDYSSPNIAKPFGIGHLRSTAIGNGLRHVFEAAGYQVVGINHLGDWGTQFGKLMSAFERWGDEEALATDPITHLYELYVRFHKTMETDATLEDEGRSWFRRLEEGDSDAQAYWERFRALSLKEFERIYKRLGVSFDHYWGEAFYNDKLTPFVDGVKASGIAEMSEGALVVRLDDLDLPPCLIVKSDGATLYSTRDLTAAAYRYEALGFEQLLYVVGAPQALHFKQVFSTLERLGHTWADRLHHVPFGHIHGISTRKGTLVFLEDILDRGKALAREALDDRPGLSDDERDTIAEQVAVGAVVFYDLSRNRIKDYDFDWDLMLRGLRPGESGRTGPYLQYTHVRLTSVLQTYVDAFGAAPAADAVDFSLLGDDKAQAVIAMLARFDEMIRQAVAQHEPAVISRYLLDLAEVFNSFYAEHKIVSDDAARSAARAALVAGTLNTLGRGLAMLGVPRPEKM